MLKRILFNSCFVSESYYQNDQRIHGKEYFISNQVQQLAYLNKYLSEEIDKSYNECLKE